MINPQVALIGAGLGWGAQRPQTQWGPRTLFELGMAQHIAQHAHINWQQMLHPSLLYTPEKKLSYAQKLIQIENFTQDLAHCVQQVYQENRFPVVLGGDHSIAIGTWSGVTAALKAQQKLGLIWIDAHMDAHTSETTPSHNIHGMPVAALLGYGESSLINIATQGPKLNPEHVVLIGVRSFEPAEADLLARLNVKVFFMDEVKQRGFAEVFAWAVNQVSAKTQGFGISIDLDAFDPTQAPGTGTRVPDGLNSLAVCQALFNLVHNPKFKALEIAEFDPVLDEHHKTATLVENLILSILGGKRYE